MSSLYLHIPYCSRKCPYCDFFSRVGSPRQLASYVALLEKHLAWLFQPGTASDELETIFFGGGTPSLLSAEQVGRLLSRLSASVGIAANAEISLEANPGTLEAGKLSGYRAAGINRLSLGVQSLNDLQLQQLGRIHTAAQAKQAIKMIRATGFDNLSLDLMFSLPGQRRHDLQEDLAELLAFAPEHLSLYGLSYEEGTEYAARLEAGTIIPVAEEEAAVQYQLIHEQLQAAGYEHYEISNFARPGYRCRHNQVYWQRQACLAVGCGGHSFTPRGWGERWFVPADLETYRTNLEQGREPAERLERFDRRGAMAETLYLALRTADGIVTDCFQEQFGETPEQAFPEAFSRLADHLVRKPGGWSFKPESWLLFDHLISYFF